MAISGSSNLFEYLYCLINQSRRKPRFFALGIGTSLSSALIQGVARAGNHFAQSVDEGEKLESKVTSILKEALTPDNGSHTMGIKHCKEKMRMITS